jgi:hypothetical protein
MNRQVYEKMLNICNHQGNAKKVREGKRENAGGGEFN